MTKISALSDIGTSVASNDTFVLVDVSDPTTPNKKIQQQNLFLIPDGSVGTPAVRFLNDTDVGLFRPTTNTLAIATGGSERLRIDSSGRLGLGTSSPDAKLKIQTSNSDTPEPAFAIRQNNAADTAQTTLTIQSDPANSTAQIRATATSSPKLALYTAGNPALTIDSSQRVGIGTTSPGTKLHVNQDSTGSVYMQISNDVDGDSNGIFFGLEGTTGNAVLQRPNSRDLTFRTASTAQVTIDSSGRLLVGTSTGTAVGAVGSHQFVVEGALGATSSISTLRTDNSASPTVITLAKSRSNAIVVDGDFVGRIEAAAHDGTDIRTPLGRIDFVVDGTPGVDDMPGRLVFSTTADGASSPTERMRIAASGRLSTFASTNPGLEFRNSAAASTTLALIYGLHSATSPTSGGTISFIVRTNGDVENTNNSYAAISDLKLKENIVDANSQWDDIKALQVRNYSFKPETNHQTHTQIGLIAQEVELVSPGLVSESPDRDAEGNDLGTVTKSVNYSVLYMKAVKALQEAMERIETLEAKVAALEGV